MFSPFTSKTLTFAGACAASFAVLPWLTPRFFKRYGDRPSELEAKFLLLCMFGLGALALWADTEPVLPAYVMGMVLARHRGQGSCAGPAAAHVDVRIPDAVLLHSRRLLVSVPALIAAQSFLVLLLAKMATKIAGVYPVTRRFGSPRQEGMYTTLLMSTGLTFGSISALYGLTHGIVDAAQYSYLVAAVIGSAVIPTLIANAFSAPPPSAPCRKARGGRRRDPGHMRR